MESLTDIGKILAEDKKNHLIERYLKEKFSDRYEPTWLNSMDNYIHLAMAIDFFYHLNNDNLNILAIASDDEHTRIRHTEQFSVLKRLLDELIIIANDNPPRTTAFHQQDALLAGLELNLKLKSRSLRDLHAQNSNLGITEKFLNEELGEAEWLCEVDLERLLIKLGIKDRTHITRLNTQDIGMILHFERVKHEGSFDSYTIPLLLNCGHNDSLGNQGTHWTCATVTINPASESIIINYMDSMRLSGIETWILTDAINYQDGNYNAFFAMKNKEVNVVSNEWQNDGWSCGYRALKSLLNASDFPLEGDVQKGENWSRFVSTENHSEALRNIVYDLLLTNLDIEADYFVAMKLNRKMVNVRTNKETYELDEQFVTRYFRLLNHSDQIDLLITTDHFTKEYATITKEILGKQIKTGRIESIKRLGEGVRGLQENQLLASDAKIFALFELLAKEYAYILGTNRGSNSELGQFIKNFCSQHFGVQLGQDSQYQIQTDGLMMRMLKDRFGLNQERAEEDNLLPPVKKIMDGSTMKTSQSSPLIATKNKILPKVTPSVDTIGSKILETGIKRLRKKPELTRLGTMFGALQFCYAEKPGGVEPGFRAIDLNEDFFHELALILSDNHFLTNDTLTDLERENLGALREALQSGDVQRKQIIFSTFINSQVKGPHGIGALKPDIQWLCYEIKKAVALNNNLSSWMYKLDYAEDQKNRINTNKEAIREFVGTRLAGIFSAKNQKQEIVWLSDSANEAHAILACGWKNGLQELRQFLHGGSEPDFNGILVVDQKAPVKYSKRIRGLGKNLIFGIAVGDRDGMGKDAQNKGFADDEYYGFDYGKPYEGEGVGASLRDDFSFEDKYAKAPALFRSSSFFGFARHFMYRNYSVFYDTSLSERMEGVHILKKMITGENPKEDVLKSFPGLRQELYRIQEQTPSIHDLLKQLINLRTFYKSELHLRVLLDTYIMQINLQKLSVFDFYFFKIKIDLIEEAMRNKIPFEEIAQYAAFIDEMAVIASKSNDAILRVFSKRVLLTKREIDLIDQLEKIFSPVSVMSHDGTVFLNTMRFDPPEGRISFQLYKEINGTYTIGVNTTNISIQSKLKDEFKLHFIRDVNGLSCNLSSDALKKLMDNTDTQYNVYRKQLLIKPVYSLITSPCLISLLNNGQTPAIDLKEVWNADNSLNLAITAATKEQAQQIKQIFGIMPVINKTELLVIPANEVQDFQNFIAKVFENEKKLTQKKDALLGLVKSSDVVSSLLNVELAKSPLKTDKWGAFHKKSDRGTTKEQALLLVNISQLMARFEKFNFEKKLFLQIKDVIKDSADSAVIEKLMALNDKTLSSSENIQAILSERFEDIKIIADELQATSSTAQSASDLPKNNLY